MNFWTNKRVIVTGGAGFLGSHIVDMLRDRGAVVIVPRSTNLDLRWREDVEELFQLSIPIDIVYHLAATVGGIGFSRAHPGQQILDGISMGANVVDVSYKYNVKRLIFAGSVCAYPKNTPVPFKESDLWSGYPEETNAAYGISKRAIIALIKAYRQEYGFNGTVLLPTNMYGPRDNFDPQSSHVIPALIRKAIDAKENDTDLTVWGTGSASRDFLYVEDAAEGFLKAGEQLDTPDPVNLGSGREVSIRSLVETICDLIGFDGDVAWDISKPDGQPRRVLDITKVKELFGWEPSTSLRDGLQKAIGWYTYVHRDP